jgi:hypothetical protein
LAHCPVLRAQASYFTPLDPRGVGRLTSERDFDKWVRQRLESWPVEMILDFERWLRGRGLVEFIPAVREASRRRTVESEPGNVPTTERGLVEDLLVRLKGLVKVRGLLEARGATVVEIEEHTAEIERLRAYLAEVVKESAA